LIHGSDRVSPFSGFPALSRLRRGQPRFVSACVRMDRFGVPGGRIVLGIFGSPALVGDFSDRCRAVLGWRNSLMENGVAGGVVAFSRRGNNFKIGLVRSARIPRFAAPHCDPAASKGPARHTRDQFYRVQLRITGSCEGFRRRSGLHSKQEQIQNHAG